VIAELFYSVATILMVKNRIVWGLLILIPAMAGVGGSGLSLGPGLSLGQGRKDVRTQAKKKRMPFIAGNGFMVLILGALFLSAKAKAGSFDDVFYIIQGLELIAGAVNSILMGMNIRDGLKRTGRVSG